MKFKNIILYITVITLTFELNSCASYKEFESFKSQTNIAILPPEFIFKKNHIVLEDKVEDIFADELMEIFIKSLSTKLQYLNYNTFIIKDTMPDSTFLTINSYLVKPVALELDEYIEERDEIVTNKDGSEDNEEKHYRIYYLRSYGNLIKYSNRIKSHSFDVDSYLEREIEHLKLLKGCLLIDISFSNKEKLRRRKFEELSRSTGRKAGQHINQYFWIHFKNNL